ncbi:MAG: asparagine-linked glycosylation protein [Cirrosporium novae-zelandiae]|nr:MAG: asparagine-linked glycosylation protein [Cirrosporium novae-zelandiae]
MWLLLLASLLAGTFSLFFFSHLPVLYVGRLLGDRLRSRDIDRREQEITRIRAVDEECQAQKRSSTKGEEDDEWEKVETYAAGTAKNGGKAEPEFEGIFGFFHPSCHGRGGGERVLWEAIKAIQQRWPRAISAVYTDDHVDKMTILESAEKNFNVPLHHPTIIFRFLHTCEFLEASRWKHLTLLGQSLGSLIPANEGFHLLIPDIFIETCNNNFTLALSKLYFPDMPTATYTHYPTISTDMLGSLDSEKAGGRGVNAGLGKGWKGIMKKRYWLLFAQLYGWVGSNADIVMVNSSWTRNHIQSLWAASRSKWPIPQSINVLYPPVNFAELESAIEISDSVEFSREPILLYIAQFRPEKNHSLLLHAFARLLRPQGEDSPEQPPQIANAKLVLLGSVREQDEKGVYSLRLLARDLNINSSVEFVCNAPWQDKNRWLRRASIGVSGMWCEHFGINVVEYQAAGLISIVNDSGGPKEDIVIDYHGGPTGYKASTEEEYAEAFKKALMLPKKDKVAMRKRARESAKRFMDTEFDTRWIKHMEELIGMLKR